MLTMKQARKAYAGRVMERAAFTDKQDGTHHRRVNRRTVRTQPFKAWVRSTYAGHATRSPKLARILNGATAAAA